MGRSPDENNLKKSPHENNLKKGPWTPEEDQKLTDCIKKYGHGNWRTIPKLAGLKRCGKSCRLRWINYLRPDIKRGNFSEEEDNIILHLHYVLGNKWSKIAAHLPGRTDNEIKNYWNVHLRKRLIQMGIDPITHQPQTDIFSLLTHGSQLIALAKVRELLEHTQLTHNHKYFNLLQQPEVVANNPELTPTNQEQNPYFSNTFQQELGQGWVEMSNFFPAENASVDGVGAQPFQIEGMIDKSSSSTWHPLPPMMETPNINSQENNSPYFVFEDYLLDNNYI